jgi:hypothetical protein
MRTRAERAFAEWTVICDVVHICQAQGFADDHIMAKLVQRPEAGVGCQADHHPRAPIAEMWMGLCSMI